jgi:hypothetical protein
MCFQLKMDLLGVDRHRASWIEVVCHRAVVLSLYMRDFGIGLEFQEVHEHLHGDMRFCPDCPIKVIIAIIEDDKHILLNSPANKAIRQSFTVQMWVIVMV